MGREVLVIGGGASGMTAAIHAARCGAQVTLLEHMDRVGRKILSTGNGRCNFSNRDQKPEYYRCGQADFPWQVIRQFPAEAAVSFLEEMGILVKERNGYLYPNSDQASSVLDVLRLELERAHVDLRTGCHTEKIVKTGRRFAVMTSQGIREADAVILAAGSKAAPATGSDGSGYELAKSLGHCVITPLPALVQLRCKEKDFKQLAGIRTEAGVKLYAEEDTGDGVSGRGRAEGYGSEKGRGSAEGRGRAAGRGSVKGSGSTAGRGNAEGYGSGAERGSAEGYGSAAGRGSVEGYGSETGRGWILQAEDIGELQLTDYGISGIPVFQVSRYASIALHRKKRVKAVVDFLPRQSPEETAVMIAERVKRMPEKSCEQWMTGLLNKKLCVVLLKRAGISPSQAAESVPADGWERLIRQLRFFETEVTAANSFEHAQVCCGGVDTSEVNPLTLESKIVRGLYLAGEILDVDGICGGYNLQWAWSSGAVAGKCAAGMQAAGKGTV